MHARIALVVSVLAQLACGGGDDPLVTVVGTGSSSGGDVNTGQCDLGGQSACSTCTEAQCLAQAKVCFCPPYVGADTCHAYQAAQLDCPADDDAGACAADLETRFPQGSAASQAYADCQAQHCKTECGL